MILLGLTGSIAMGKSRAAAMFRAFGVPVFDADAVVHALTAPRGAAVAAVDAAFPGCLSPEGGIDRACLGRRVLGEPAALRRLEAILHPAVRAAEGRFLRTACRSGARVALLDIPLLFETDGERRLDAVVVVSAHPLLQAQRALRRRGMTAERLSAIRRQQLADAEKRRRADFVIRSGYDAGALAQQVGEILAAVASLEARAWPQAWMRRVSRPAGRRA